MVPLDPGKLFKRFSKGGQSTDQHGLGLSIIKQITEVSGKQVSYHFEKGKHVFSIRFSVKPHGISEIMSPVKYYPHSDLPY